MANLDFGELQDLWVEAGGDHGIADVAAAVALAESHGDPSAIDNSAFRYRPGYHAPPPGADKEYSVGLWQINVLAHPSYSSSLLLEPLANAKAAISISLAAAGFGPWSTYTSGAYLQYLPGKPPPISVVIPPPPISDSGVAPSSEGGWSALRHAVNRNLASDLVACGKARELALRTLAGG